MRIYLFNRPVYDGLKAILIEGFQELGHEVFVSEFSNFAPKDNLRIIKSWNDLETYDVVVWGEEEIVQVDHLPGKPSQKQVLVFADGGDISKIRVNKRVSPHIFVKRELLQKTSKELNKIIPIGLGVERRFWQEPKPHLDRLFSYSCMLRLNSNPFRKTIQRSLENLDSKFQATKFVGETGEIAYGNGATLPRPTPKYFEILQNSRISISCHGAGQDCLRFWEILASGAMLFAQNLDIEMLHPFNDGENIVFFSNIKEFEEKMCFYLSKPKLVEEIAFKGREHAKNYHTSSERVKVIITQILELKKLGIENISKVNLSMLQIYWNNVRYSFRKKQLKYLGY